VVGDTSSVDLALPKQGTNYITGIIFGMCGKSRFDGFHVLGLP